MKKALVTTALLSAVVCFTPCPANAQRIGQACSSDPDTVRTLKSIVPTEGVIECIPNSDGNYFWQPMGAGIARYDSTTACSVAGNVRWNGSSIQFCNGSSWQGVGGGKTTVVGGCQTYWSTCPAGYVATSYLSPGTYNCCDKCGNPAWRYTVCSQ